MHADASIATAAETAIATTKPTATIAATALAAPSVVPTGRSDDCCQRVRRVGHV